MSDEIFGQTPCWFVLNYIDNAFKKDSAQKTIDRFNEINGSTLRLFAPTYVERINENGRYKFKTVRLSFHYVFVNGTFSEVKNLCALRNGFSFLINRGSRDRYSVIGNEEMQHFKNIARAYENCLPYYPLDDIDLEDGDLVEVVNGDFPGLVGTFMPKAGSKTGNIVLMVYNRVGTIAYNISVSDVRVLEFSRKSNRANDQIDAFTSQLLQSLRYYNDDRALPHNLTAKLSVFCSRMDCVKISNHKLDAKLQALLFAGNYILGNIESANGHFARYDKLKASITNIWTKSLVALIIAVIHNDRQMLDSSVEYINGKEPTSKSQKAIAAEVSYYITRPNMLL